MSKESKKLKWSDLPEASELSQALEQEKYRERYLKTLKSTVSTLVVVAAIAILTATLWLPVLQIYGNSMTPNLESGDMVVSVSAQKLRQGNVVAFYYNNKVLVKRVIATEGQWVDIDSQGTVSVDGQKLEEPYLADNEKGLGDTNIQLPYQVPEGKFFVMGDHRGVSIDSRNTAIGSIGNEQIVGRLVLRVWPLNRIQWVK
ncbi:S26 family signal peptidase [Streptococcus oralis subsp. tigurinus]|uniref:Signal peptidase I n=1 Tax=Streptococcus oralis subsp. tigurinus TaxID=1077464 RepID=A0A1X0WXS5_STROR|nr:signal peptidase I [Streptococcus oralis]ORJ31615.1 S26 family signal peptidase [Streptococcus oralis subsp. tigurinus]